MAIAFDATSAFDSASSTSHTHAHTCTGSDRFLAVMIVGDTGGGNDDITGVTYNSVAMTLADKIVDAGIARYVYLYTLIAPATGANNVVVSATNSHFLGVIGASYTGVSQTGQPEVTSKTYSEADADGVLAHTITPTTANSWVILGAGGYAGGPLPQASTGSTLRVVDTSFGLIGLFDSNAALAASSQSLTWTYGGGSSGDMGSILIAIAPAGGGGGSTPSPAAGALSLAGLGTHLGFAINMPDEV
jgi:hypothetical protein